MAMAPVAYALWARSEGPSRMMARSKQMPCRYQKGRLDVKGPKINQYPRDVTVPPTFQLYGGSIILAFCFSYVQWEKWWDPLGNYPLHSNLPWRKNGGSKSL